MRIEDRNTVGLVGPERRSESADGDIGTFVRFCRNTLSSQKTQTAGGSYGLGKSVNWRCSLVSTVLVNSKLSEPHDGKVEYRLFGRTDLGFHSIKDQYFSGRGQFGHVNGEGETATTDSMWADNPLVRSLYLERETKKPGTSILVVGFHSPAEPEADRGDLHELVVEAWVENFWLALHRGDLKIDVEVANGSEVETTVTLRAADHRPELVEALEKYEAGDLVDELRDPGDVIVHDIKLEVPSTRSAAPTQHKAFAHTAKLIVRLADESRPGRTNRIALMRGPAMVVEHLGVSEAQTGGIPFDAFVLCGNLAGDSDHDAYAEAFLRAAEPPAHDRWESTDGLAAKYHAGYKKGIDEFKYAIKAKTLDQFRRRPTGLEEGPEALKKMLRIDTPPPTSPTPRLKSLDGGIEGDRWNLTAEFSMSNRDNGWSFVPVVEFVGENRSVEIPWAELRVETSGCTLEDGTNRLHAPKAGKTKNRTVRISGTTDPDGQPIPPDRAAVTVRAAKASQADKATTP